MTAKTTALEPTYRGSVRSACARVRKIMKAAGITLGRVEGRYYACGPSGLPFDDRGWMECVGEVLS